MTASLAGLVLAGAVLVAAGPSGAERLRALAGPRRASRDVPAVRPLWVAVSGLASGALGWAVGGSPAVGALATAAGVGLGVAARRAAARPPRATDDPLELAAAWAQLAVCLEVGLPVAVAVGAAAAPLDGRAGTELRRVSGLLELGADPAQAWETAGQVPALSAFARAAGRSSGTGAALARAARAESTRLQATLTDLAEARAQRAAVLVTAPLGLCFLPAFLALGIAPVVIGLAGQALSRW